MIALAASSYGNPALPLQNKPSCEGLNMPECLAQYTDSSWQFYEDDLKEWALAAFSADFDTTTGVCKTYKKEVKQAYEEGRMEHRVLLH